MFTLEESKVHWNLPIQVNLIWTDRWWGLSKKSLGNEVVKVFTTRMYVVMSFRSFLTGEGES